MSDNIYDNRLETKIQPSLLSNNAQGRMRQGLVCDENLTIL